MLIEKRIGTCLHCGSEFRFQVIEGKPIIIWSRNKYPIKTEEEMGE